MTWKSAGKWIDLFDIKKNGLNNLNDLIIKDGTNGGK